MIVLDIVYEDRGRGADEILEMNEIIIIVIEFGERRESI